MIFENSTYGQERALYNTCGGTVRNCRFAGEEDGESALKESRDITVERCYFDLRYPLWHVKGLTLRDSEMTENCRAALWYCDGVSVFNSKMNGIKAFRECKNIALQNVEANSPEYGWRCENIAVKDSTLNSVYAFFESRDIEIDRLHFAGKYSFQYTKNVTISNSELDTKDAFWHAKNVTVKDSLVKGEYLGWYSEGLTLVRCRIEGTQPLCYCKKLRLIDCVMEGCDLAFEYSDVQAELRGGIASVKNPLKGTIVADRFGEIITEDSVYSAKGKAILRSSLHI